MGSNPLCSSTDDTLSEQAVEECLHVREIEKISGKWVTVCWREGLLTRERQPQPHPSLNTTGELWPPHSPDQATCDIDL